MRASQRPQLPHTHLYWDQVRHREEDLSSPTDVSTHVPASPRERDTFFFYRLSGFGLKPTAKPQEGGFRSREISNQPLQLPGFVLPAQVLSLGTHTQIFVSHHARLRAAGGHNLLTVLQRLPGTGHTSPFALGDWGLGPTLSGGRSHVQGTLKIHSEGFRARPYESSVLPGGKCHPGRQSSHPALPEEQDSAQHHRGLRCPRQSYHLHTVSFQGQLEVGISAPTLQLLPGTGTQPRSPRGCSCAQVPSPAQAPGALHKTLDKQQHKGDQKLLTQP